MQFLVGTSGYSYKEWKGNFYPQKWPQKNMLPYYAERFRCVEVNNTYYRLPTEKVVRSWADQVPASFRFALKAQQAITHDRRLKDAHQQVDDFLHVASLLGEKLGPILFQLPPSFRKDLPRLDAFLRHIAGRARTAFEFRHASWFDDEVFGCLRTHAAALCVADSEDLPHTELVPTADFGYLRLRDEAYTDASLCDWIERTKSQPWSEAFVFFKHEDAGTGPKLANRFLELANNNP